MKTEAEFKKAFKQSAKQLGGYAISIAAPMMPGLPDLYCIMPGLMPILLEAKFIKDVEPTFKRKIEYTKLQIEYMNECNKVQNYAAMGLIGVKYRSGHIVAVIVPPTETHVSNETFGQYGWSELVSKRFNVYDMMYRMPIPRINHGQVPNTYCAADDDYVDENGHVRIRVRV